MSLTWVDIEADQITGNSIRESICGYFAIHKLKNGYLDFQVKVGMCWDSLAIIDNRLLPSLEVLINYSEKDKNNINCGWLKCKGDKYYIAKEIVRRLKELEKCYDKSKFDFLIKERVY